MKWIDVNDELPDDDICVLVFCEDADEPIWFGYHDSDSGDWRYYDESGSCDPTHWMDLPDPPTP